MAADRRPFCAEVSAQSAEPLAATASRIDHWVLVEYRGLWAHDPLPGSALSAEIREHLAAQVASLPRCRLLFIRRPERRGHSALACFYAESRERGSRLTQLELERYDDLLDVDFVHAPGDLRQEPLLVVCTHGKRDRCCARYGRPLYDALRDVADEGTVWQSSHVGGDRFAGNVVCLPEGLYFGRVEPAEAWALFDEYLGGRISLDHYRGRCCYSFVEQAAERALREQTGLLGLDDVQVLGAERADGGWDVRVAAGGAAHQVHVVAERGDLTHLTCSADALRRPRHYAAVTFRPLEADDLRLVHAWIQKPHVREWWGEREYADVEGKYLPAIGGDDPTDHYLILLGGRPIGFVETYLVSDYPEWEEHVRVGPGVAGVDLFIGEEAFLHRGLGPQVLRQFVREVVFADPRVHAVVAAPDVRNRPSIRAFEKAGFVPVRVFEVPGEPAPEQLLRLDRGDQ